MKLRILGNSIRLRLTQTEVRDLIRIGRVGETTQFGPDNNFEYELILSSDLDLQVRFKAGKISITLPTSIGLPWAKGDEVSLKQNILTPANTNLFILIEKDFKCKTERIGENEDDMFPNPTC